MLSNGMFILQLQGLTEVIFRSKLTVQKSYLARVWYRMQLSKRASEAAWPGVASAETSSFKSYYLITQNIKNGKTFTVL